jgi:hypothetical protein
MVDADAGRIDFRMEGEQSRWTRELERCNGDM